MHQLLVRDDVVMHMLSKAAQNTIILAFLTLQILNLATLISSFYIVFVSVHYYIQIKQKSSQSMNI